MIGIPISKNKFKIRKSYPHQNPNQSIVSG